MAKKERHESTSWHTTETISSRLQAATPDPIRDCSGSRKCGISGQCGLHFPHADAARIEELILTGITPTPPNPTIVKVGRNKHKNVRWRYEKEARKPIAELKARGYRVFALEITEEAKPYYETDWPPKTCLVIGHEDQSVTRATLALCDDVVFIPLWGKGLSLNVHVALAVAVFHIRYLGLVGNHLAD